MGMSIDDAVVESQSTFICRTILPWDPEWVPHAEWIEDLFWQMTGLEKQDTFCDEHRVLPCWYCAEQEQRLLQSRLQEQCGSGD